MNRAAYLAIGVLLGLLAGLGAGWAAFRTETAARSTRSPSPAPAPSREVRLEEPLAAAPAPPSHAKKRKDARSLPAPVAPVESVQSGPVLEAGLGRVEVDVAGSDVTQATLTGRGLEGPETMDRGAEDAVIRFDVVPGTYRLEWWPDGAMSERALRVRVEADRVTRVRAADPATPDQFPIPDGLGRIDVTVLERDGTPMEDATVRVVGTGMQGPEDTLQTTTAEGRARFHLRAGPVRVRVGGQEHRVGVAEGETVRVEFRYEGEGEVLFAGRAGHVALRRRGEPSWEASWGVYEERRTRLVYVPPGEYEIGYHGATRSGGFVTVGRGETVRFEIPKPPGRIRVEIVAPGEGFTKSMAYELAVKGPNAPGNPRHVYIMVPTAGRVLQHVFTEAGLEPGRYLVTASVPGYHPVEERVEVGDGETVLRVPLAPLR